jgi:hypothetical protein
MSPRVPSNNPSDRERLLVDISRSPAFAWGSLALGVVVLGSVVLTAPEDRPAEDIPNASPARNFTPRRDSPPAPSSIPLRRSATDETGVSEATSLSNSSISNSSISNSSISFFEETITLSINRSLAAYEANCTLLQQHRNEACASDDFTAEGEALHALVMSYLTLSEEERLAHKQQFVLVTDPSSSRLKLEAASDPNYLYQWFDLQKALGYSNIDMRTDLVQLKNAYTAGICDDRP